MPTEKPPLLSPTIPLHYSGRISIIHRHSESLLPFTAAPQNIVMAVVINLHAGGAIIPIILPPEKCTTTTWGELCKEFMENYLPKANPNAIFQILLEISPTKRLSQYFVRYGDGNSSIVRVDWSSSSVPGLDPLPLSAEYIDVNMVLKPRVRRNLINLAKPHLPVQPVGIVSFPSSLHVDLCFSVASSAEPPFPYNEDQMSVLYLKEHAIYTGCVDKFEIMAVEDGNHNLLPTATRVSQASSAAAATSTTAGKKQSNKEQTAPTKAKAKSSTKRKREGTSNKSDDDEEGTKKSAAKQKGEGGAVAAAAAAAAAEPKKKSPPKVLPAATTAKTKKSPPKEPSTAVGLKSPPKKSGEEMIQLYKEMEAAKKLKQSSSSSSKTDSPSIPKVISSKTTTKVSSPKKKTPTTSTKKDSAKKSSADSVAESPKKSTDVARARAPSADIGNEMIRRYNESKEAEKAKEDEGGKEKPPSKSKKKSDESSAKSSSSGKKSKGSLKKDKTKEGGEGESAKKPSAAAATAAKKSGEDDKDKTAPSAKAGNEMIRLYMEAKAKEKDKSTSKKTDDSTKSSSVKKAKASSSKKDKAKSDEGESAKKASAPGEEGISATKKSKAAGAEEANVSKKKRKAPTTEDETFDAPKSPSKKKAKISKADGSTSKKDDTKSVATQKEEPKQKKRGPKRKNYDNIPSEPAEGFPEGWTLKTIPRSTTGYDQRWYAPSGHTFNSKKAARSFEELLYVGLDDSTAYKLFEEKEKKAKEERKAQREAAKKEKAESENAKTAKHINERVTLSKNTSYCRMCYRSQVGLKKSSIEKRRGCKKSKMGCVKCNEPICNDCWRKGHECKNKSAPAGDVGPSAAVDENKNRLYSDFSAEASPAGKGKIPSKKSDDSTKSASSKRTGGSSKKDKAKDNEGQSAKKPSASEKEASPKEEAKASTKKRKAPTDAMSSDKLKTPNEKKSKMSKADVTSPLKVTFAADVKKSDAPIKTTPAKKSQKRPSKSAESNDKKLVHCGGCNGCLQDPCRKCSACTASPKRRCKRRPCHKPRFVSIAEFKEMMTGLV